MSSQLKRAPAIALPALLVLLVVLKVGLTIPVSSVPVFVATITPTAFPTLKEQVGFSDTTIEALQGAGVHSLNDDVSFGGYGHQYRLLGFNPGAFKLAGEQEYRIGNGKLLLYQTDNPQPRLIWTHDTHDNRPNLSGKFPAPGDWNADNSVVWGAIESFGTTGWPLNKLYLYQLNSDNTVRPLLKGVIPPGYIANAVEKQPDGSLLVVAGDYRDEFVMGLDKWSEYTCCGPYIFKYFKWWNGNYIDVSAQFPDKYANQIGSILYHLTTQSITADERSPQLFSLLLLRLLEIYENLGQRNAGWLLVQNLVLQAKKSGRLIDNTYVDTIFMPTMAQLQRENKPFIAPDYFGDNPRSIPDLYGE